MYLARLFRVRLSSRPILQPCPIPPLALALIAYRSGFYLIRRLFLNAVASNADMIIFLKSSVVFVKGFDERLVTCLHDLRLTFGGLELERRNFLLILVQAHNVAEVLHVYCFSILDFQKLTVFFGPLFKRHFQSPFLRKECSGKRMFWA